MSFYGPRPHLAKVTGQAPRRAPRRAPLTAKQRAANTAIDYAYEQLIKIEATYLKAPEQEELKTAYKAARAAYLEAGKLRDQR